MKRIHNGVFVGKINARDIPVVLGFPSHQISDHVNNGSVADFDLRFLLRSAKRNRIRSVLFAHPDSKLLSLRLDEELDKRREPKLLGSLDVTLHEIA